MNKLENQLIDKIEDELDETLAEWQWQKATDQLMTNFEKKSHQDENKVEFWYARELKELLEYVQWRDFINVMNKARIACKKSGHSVENHFAEVRKMVAIGSNTKRSINDIKLTRYACYLIAQNADPRKKPVAFAQTYFAIQTRKQEIQQNQTVNEDLRRKYLRDQIKEHNKHLNEAAKKAGVGITANNKTNGIEFAKFHNAGYKGLYCGFDMKAIKNKKGLKKNQQILDHMGSTELAANFFRVTQTEEKLKRESIKGKEQANETHYQVGQKVRETMKELGGVMPEDLPTFDSIKKVEKRIKKSEKV